MGLEFGVETALATLRLKPLLQGLFRLFVVSSRLSRELLEGSLNFPG